MILSIVICPATRASLLVHNIITHMNIATSKSRCACGELLMGLNQVKVTTGHRDLTQQTTSGVR